jgi:hypothetical protein
MCFCAPTSTNSPPRRALKKVTPGKRSKHERGGKGCNTVKRVGFDRNQRLAAPHLDRDTVKGYGAATPAATVGDKSMPTDILFDLTSHDRPLGTAARALGSAGINIEGLSGPTTVEGTLSGHLLVEDAAGATRALEDAGLRVIRQQDVLVLDLEDRPGALADLYASLNAIPAYHSVDFAYVASRSRLVMAIDPPEALESVRRTLGAR